MNKVEEAFQRAVSEHNPALALAIAERASTKTQDTTEKRLWAKRAEQIRKGRLLKFSRREVRDIR